MFAKNKNRCRLLLTGMLFLMLLFGITAQAHAAWVKNGDGTYSYKKSNGTIARSQWISKKYYVNSQGIRVTGKQKIGSKWYYFSAPKGKVQKNKWIRDGAYRYYAGKNGVLYKKGIYEINEKKYLFNANAVMRTGKCTFKKKTYYLIPNSGQMLVNTWAKIDDYYYFFDKNGAMVKGKWLSGYTYYLDANGHRVSDTWKGARYLGSDGASYSGLKEIAGVYYYFDPKTRKKATNTPIEIDGKRWYFDDEGKGYQNDVPAPGQGVDVQPEYYMHPVVDDEVLLSYIIYCEAGNQPYEGQLGVGYVVLNRVYSSEFKESTVREAVYAKNQFNPVWDGAMARVYKNPLIVTEQCKQAAKEVMQKRAEIAAGKPAVLLLDEKEVEFNYLFFMRKESYKRLKLKSKYKKIGDHVFFVKWEK